MKVYAVTTGCYSDYRIDCIFSTKEKADEYVKCYSNSREYDNDEVQVEEYELDDPEKCFAINNKDLFHYFIEMRLDFSLMSISKHSIIERKNYIPKVIPRKNKKEFEIECYAKSMKEATKIAADKLHQYLANSPGWKIKE